MRELNPEYGTDDSKKGRLGCGKEIVNDREELLCILPPFVRRDSSSPNLTRFRVQANPYGGIKTEAWHPRRGKEIVMKGRRFKYSLTVRSTKTRSLQVDQISYSSRSYWEN